jgi:hypothetical protein
MALWTPGNLNDGSLELWFDANNSGSLSLTGSTVNSWTDLVHSVSAVPTQTAPTYNASLLNSLPGIVFAGGATTTGLDTSSHGSFSNPVSAFIVTMPTGANAWGEVYSANVGGQGGPSFGFRNGASPQFFTVFRGGQADSVGTLTLATNVPGIIEFITPAISGGSIGPIAEYLTGNVGGSSSAIAVGGTQNGIQIGWGGGGDFYPGNIHEIVILNVQASTTNQQLIEGYLAWKWGLQGGLPGGHPYASAAPTVSLFFVSNPNAIMPDSDWY